MFDAPSSATDDFPCFTSCLRGELSPARFLVVEDDPVVSRVLTRSLRVRGYAVDLAVSAEHALAMAQQMPPDYVILELKVSGVSTLPLIGRLHAVAPSARVCLHTAYASIASAVEAIKLGACYYLAKPAPLDEILLRLGIVSLPVCETGARRPGASRGPRRRAVLDSQYGLHDIEWRHIMHTLRECGGNITEASRRLKMHRRTLHRKIVAHGGADMPALMARLRDGAVAARDQRVNCV